jgi:hypothetical protein
MESSLTNFTGKMGINENRIININQGPQFKTKGGTILAMLFLLFFALLVVSLFHAEFLVSLIILIISGILFNLVLDIRGIQVDSNTHKIRRYKLFLFFRLGKWMNLGDFRTIYLMQKNLTVRTSGYSEYSSSTFHYYHIKLVDELNNKEIFLAEYSNYYKAQKIAMNIANATGLEFKDFLKGTKKTNK